LLINRVEKLMSVKRAGERKRERRRASYLALSIAGQQTQTFDLLEMAVE
jgi:hypothetical protein